MRTITFDKISNFRDLGGLTTQNGKKIKEGFLFRSANPWAASSNDYEKLKNKHLDIIIDFRDQKEKKEEEKSIQSLFPYDPQPIAAANLAPDTIYSILKDATKEKVSEAMIGLYKEFPITYSKQFKTVFDFAAKGKKILFHCTAGKDRTGFAAALLLSALDVAPSLILEDFLASNTHFKAGAMQIKKELAPYGIPEEVIEPLFSVQKDYLDASLQVIQKEFGTVENYIRDYLLINTHQLREHYIEK